MKERKAGNDPSHLLIFFNLGRGVREKKQVPWAALLLRAKPRRVQAAKSYPSV